MAKNEVAKKEEAGPLAVIDFGADAGSGFENTNTDDFAIPFLRMLQAGSPQAKRTQPEYIKGAEEGDMINTVTGRLYKGHEGVDVIPCAYIHKYNLWAQNREGFRGSVTADEYERMSKHKGTVNTQNGPKEVELDEAGNIITDTREHYVLIVHPDGSFVPALLALASTQLKKSKKWMSLMDAFKLPTGARYPMFSKIYKVTPIAESKDDFSWAGYNIEYLKDIDNPVLYTAAKAFNESVRKGTIKAAPIDDEDLPY